MSSEGEAKGSTGNGSAGLTKKSQNNEIKLLSSQGTNKVFNGSKRSNSISRRSGASGSSMSVTNPADGPKKGKLTKPTQRQRLPQQQKGDNPEKQEKDKLAEEIKLNVQSLGMDLLNNSSAATKPLIISKVNGVRTIASPKSLFKSGEDLADGEGSPKRSQEAVTSAMETENSRIDPKNITLANLMNSEESEDDVTLDAGKDALEDDEDADDFSKRLDRT